MYSFSRTTSLITKLNRKGSNNYLFNHLKLMSKLKVTATSRIKSRPCHSRCCLISWSWTLFLQTQPSVCPCLGAVPGLSAEKQTGEPDEEAGRAPRSAGEGLSVQDQPSSSSSSSAPGASSLPQPPTDQNQSHQEGRRLLHSEHFFFFKNLKLSNILQVHDLDSQTCWFCYCCR